MKARYKNPSKQASLDAYFVHLQRMMSDCIDDEYKKLKERNAGKSPHYYRKPDNQRFE